MRRTIETFSAGNAGQAQRFAELEGSIAALRTANTTLETSAAEKDRTISSLRTENTNLTQTVSRLSAANQEHEQEISSLRNQIDVIRQLLQN